MEIGKIAATTITMRHFVVFLLGSDSIATMGQALLFRPMLWKCFYNIDDQSLRSEGGVLHIFSGGGWLVGSVVWV